MLNDANVDWWVCIVDPCRNGSGLLSNNHDWMSIANLDSTSTKEKLDNTKPTTLDWLLLLTRMGKVCKPTWMQVASQITAIHSKKMKEVTTGWNINGIRFRGRTTEKTICIRMHSTGLMISAEHSRYFIVCQSSTRYHQWIEPRYY